MSNLGSETVLTLIPKGSIIFLVLLLSQCIFECTMDSHLHDSDRSLLPNGSYFCFHGDALTLEYYAAVVVDEFLNDYQGYFGDFDHYMTCAGNPGDKASFIVGHFCAFQVMFGMPFTMLQLCDFPDPILSPSSPSLMSSVTDENNAEHGDAPMVVVAGAPCQSFSAASPVSSSPTPLTPTSLPRPSPPSPDDGF